MKAIKLVYGKQVTRRSFDMTSMAPELFSYAEEHGKDVYKRQHWHSIIKLSYWQVMYLSSKAVCNQKGLEFYLKMGKMCIRDR